MKNSFTLAIFLGLLINGCGKIKKPTPAIFVNNSQVLIKDSLQADSIKNKIHFISDRYYSEFKTPIHAYIFTNNVVVDSIIEPDFHMVSWYSSHNDTVSLSAHVGQFETAALLIRFVDGKFNASFFRAPHSGQAFFRINKDDPFSSQIEVPLLRYKLHLTQIPDTISKPIVFGYIDMESLEYYDKRDSLNQKSKIQMKFYFRSQFRNFEKEN